MRQLARLTLACLMLTPPLEAQSRTRPGAGVPPPATVSREVSSTNTHIPAVLGYDRTARGSIEGAESQRYRFMGYAGSQVGIGRLSQGELQACVEVRDPDGELVALLAPPPPTPGWIDMRDRLTELVPLTLDRSGWHELRVFDQSRSLPGSYTLSVHCLEGYCPPASLVISRNGSNINRECYRSIHPPIVDTTWQARIDAAQYGPSVLETFVWVSTGPGAGTLALNGNEILIEPGLTPLCAIECKVTPEGYGTCERTVPESPSLIGLDLTTQAVIVLEDGSYELCNALALTFGY